MHWMMSGDEASYSLGTSCQVSQKIVYLSICDVIESLNQVCKCGFSTATVPNNSHCLTLTNGKTEFLNNLYIDSVCVRDMMHKSARNHARIL